MCYKLILLILGYFFVQHFVILNIPGVTIIDIISTPGLSHSKTDGSVCDNKKVGSLVL